MERRLHFLVQGAWTGRPRLGIATPRRGRSFTSLIPREGEPIIRYSTEPNSPVVELTVEGRITDADLRANIERLRDDLERNGKTRILEVIQHFTGMEPQALWTDLKLGLPLVHKVSRVAVVADQAWIRTVSHLGRFFTSAELKIFEPAELDQARTWIAQG